MPTATIKHVDDECEKKDCKAVKVNLTFISFFLCNIRCNTVDATIATISGNGVGPYSIDVPDLSTVPTGLNLVVDGSSVKVQGVYAHDVFGASWSAKFRINDANKCCGCGEMTMNETPDAVCDPPCDGEAVSQKYPFGGAQISCTDPAFDLLTT
jgi:hypothetical protein